VCVIGAGYTAISTALFCWNKALESRYWRQARWLGAFWSANGGQIVNSYSRDIDVIERKRRAQQARLLEKIGTFEGARIHPRTENCQISEFSVPERRRVFARRD